MDDLTDEQKFEEHLRRLTKAKVVHDAEHTDSQESLKWAEKKRGYKLEIKVPADGIPVTGLDSDNSAKLANEMSKDYKDDEDISHTANSIKVSEGMVKEDPNIGYDWYKQTPKDDDKDDYAGVP